MEETKATPKLRRKHVTVRMPEATWKKLQAMANTQGLTLNALLLGRINELISEDVGKEPAKGAIKFV